MTTDPGLSYEIQFIQQKNKQKTMVYGATNDNEVTSLITRLFKGRFNKPESLTPIDGVRILIKRIDRGINKSSVVFNRRIYNKSVRQARIMVEKEIIQ